MLSNSKITIPLEQKTINKLKTMKEFNNIDNITTYCKKILIKTIDNEYESFRKTKTV